LDPRFERVGPDQHRHGRRGGNELAQHVQPLRSQESGHEGHAGDVAARPVEAADHPAPTRGSTGRFLLLQSLLWSEAAVKGRADALYVAPEGLVRVAAEKVAAPRLQGRVMISSTV